MEYSNCEHVGRAAGITGDTLGSTEVDRQRLQEKVVSVIATTSAYLESPRIISAVSYTHLSEDIFSGSFEPVSIWHRRTPMRAIPVSPNRETESSNVDEIKIIRSRFCRPRGNERHGNN